MLLRAGSDGRLALLLRSVFHPLVSLAGLVLLVWAMALVLPQHNRPMEPPGPRLWRSSVISALIALLLITLPPNPSFADLAQRRPGDDSTPSELSFVLPPAQRSLTDWVRLLRSQNDPRLYAGDPVRISGFVLPRSDGPPLLARLLVRCCLADATPVGLPVRWEAAPPGQSHPKADQWLQINGVMAVQQGPGGEELVVIPRRITPIQRPARPLEP
ncbi:MAG: TIGR03943 family protein [Cyanobacteriota bacterium]|nr:TIGR03943 family protein [Cyanobacteriota bacterium]